MTESISYMKWGLWCEVRLGGFQTFQTFYWGARLNNKACFLKFAQRLLALNAQLPAYSNVVRGANNWHNVLEPAYQAEGIFQEEVGCLDLVSHFCNQKWLKLAGNWCMYGNKKENLGMKYVILFYIIHSKCTIIPPKGRREGDQIYSTPAMH